jgi:predicted transcriptional regulator
MDTKKILNKREYVALCLCDEGLGLTDIIAKRLVITEQIANKIMDRLVKLGLARKEKSYLTQKGKISKNSNKPIYWYETTQLGENYLEKMAQYYEVTP